MEAIDTACAPVTPRPLPRGGRGRGRGHSSAGQTISGGISGFLSTFGGFMFLCGGLPVSGQVRRILPGSGAQLLSGLPDFSVAVPSVLHG